MEIGNLLVGAVERQMKILDAEVVDIAFFQCLQGLVQIEIHESITRHSHLEFLVGVGSRLRIGSILRADHQDVYKRQYWASMIGPCNIYICKQVTEPHERRPIYQALPSWRECSNRIQDML